MNKLGVPESSLPILGVLKAAGALGLLIGLGVPLIGIVATGGLTLFFIAAVITHLRARDSPLETACRSCSLWSSWLHSFSESVAGERDQRERYKI